MSRGSADHTRKIRSAARKGGQNADHASPLRRVVGVTVNEQGHDREELECGHLHRVSMGSMARGDYPGRAERRRCRKCAHEGRTG